MIWIESSAAGSKRPDFAPFGFVPTDDELEREDFRVRHLISKLVRESVRDFHLREREGAFQFLTAEKIAEGVARGKLGRPREEGQRADVESAVGAALQSFEDGLYLLFVDGHQKTELDEPVVLKLDSKIRLIRLTALGGL